LSELLTFEAFGPDQRSLGRIHEVVATQHHVRGPVVGPLPVTGYVVGPRNTGSTMGYDRHPEHGPWLLRVGVLALHRHDTHVPAVDVGDLDVVHQTLTVRRLSAGHDSD
jgi:hypothetical protein